jgi:hypothetical protein
MTIAFHTVLLPNTQLTDTTRDGGTAPFFLMLVPVSHTAVTLRGKQTRYVLTFKTTELTAGRIMNISMPAEGSPPYRHTFTLPEPGGLEMVATMYDADGFGSGGATDVLSKSFH